MTRSIRVLTICAHCGGKMIKTFYTQKYHKKCRKAAKLKVKRIYSLKERALTRSFYREFGIRKQDLFR